MNPIQLDKPSTSSVTKTEENFYDGPSWKSIKGDWKIEENDEAVCSHMWCEWIYALRFSQIAGLNPSNINEIELQVEVKGTGPNFEDEYKIDF